jgi:hypothetical protein
MIFRIHGKGGAGMELHKIAYADLNPRQKENFNFQKVSAILADYGYVTFRLSDDWQGADFIALHISGEVLRVQLKGRLTFDRKYQGKGLYVAFAYGETWYLYPHDEALAKILQKPKISTSQSWQKRGNYHFPHLSAQLLAMLEPYSITGDALPIPD